MSVGEEREHRCGDSEFCLGSRGVRESIRIRRKEREGFKPANLLPKRKDGYLYLCLYVYVSIYISVSVKYMEEGGSCRGREGLRRGFSSRSVFRPALTSPGASLCVNTALVSSYSQSWEHAASCRPASGGFVSQGPWLSEVSPVPLEGRPLSY